MAHIDINFISNVLLRAVQITLILPTKTAPTLQKDFIDNPSTYYQDKKDKKYPLLILLHGLLNDCNNWTSYARAELYAEEHNIAICSISGENSCYVNHGNNNFFDFIEYELRDFLYGTFPISSKREDNFIAGLSMGGVGALHHAFACPEHYSAVGAFSSVPYLKNPYFKGIFKGDEIQSSLLKSLMENKEIPYVYMSIGDLDNQDYIKQNKKLVKILKQNSINHEFHIEKNFSHEWRFWDQELEKFLKKLPRVDAYFKEIPRGV